MVERAKFEFSANTTSLPRVSAVAVRSPSGFLSSARPRAAMLALKAEKSGAAFLRSVAAPSAVTSTTPVRPLFLPHRAQAAQLHLVTAHVELYAPVFKIAHRVVKGRR